MTTGARKKGKRGSKVPKRRHAPVDYGTDNSDDDSSVDFHVTQRYFSRVPTYTLPSWWILIRLFASSGIALSASGSDSGDRDDLGEHEIVATDCALMSQHLDDLYERKLVRVLSVFTVFLAWLG